MYIEVQLRSGRKYYYLVENVRSNGHWKKIKVYLGSNLAAGRAKELASAKKKILEEKVDSYAKTSDPLLSLVQPSEAKALDEAKRLYAMAIRRMNKSMLRNQYMDFLISFTYNTNAIEGSTLSLLDTKFLLEDRIAPDGKTIREINEAQNHKDAFDYMISYEGSLTKSFVLKLHKLLMHSILWKQAGTFRDVHVKLAGVDKILPPPSDIASKFKDLTLWHARNQNRYHPIVSTAYFHYAFESIHPFRDGNGRVGRLIINHMLKKSGFPMIDIKYRDRRTYYGALQSGDDGNLRPLVKMFIGYVVEQARDIANMSAPMRKAP
ncbi:MAG: Fic family protein [Candidatus Aenigmatarchaeota archaeon]